jgi:hypothetical protein
MDTRFCQEGDKWEDLEVDLGYNKTFFGPLSLYP